MIAAYRRRTVTGSALISAGMPQIEQADCEDNRLDRVLRHAWGCISPRVLSGLWRGQLGQLVQRIENQEKQLMLLSDERLRQTANELRGSLVLTGIHSEGIAVAFALAREAARRHTGMRHFPVQLLGGAAMMGGAIAEMQTGEGKSLTALLPAVGTALMGRPVHVITVNDYLAQRDAEQFRAVYNALGLTVGLVQQGQEAQDRHQAYACDVTYCTNKELVFDYLRDRLALGGSCSRTRLLIHEMCKSRLSGRSRDLLLRGLHCAIVDEADSVLVDEARTPLILSGMQGRVESDATLYETALDFARRLVPGEDFHMLANERTIRLTVLGERRVTELAVGLQGLWAIRRAREELVQQALSALYFFQKDVQYIVSHGRVQIVDEYTGRVMPDRSWEHGLHQLIEVKENCAITERHHTLARITYQRFFRRYIHLCGMTGTAIETAGELRAVYGLRVVRIPTNRPRRSANFGTRMFPTSVLKRIAVVESAKKEVYKNRAVLIGTRSVGTSEQLGELLLAAGLHPVILNARQSRQEAEIIADAGQPGRVTVATNMAGRGTDIKLHPVVREAGGLHIILTEYHESRRIDRQLFGRAGRQGDPGSYEAIVALEDELFQRFAGTYLLSIVTGAVQLTKRVSPVLGRVVTDYSQVAAERSHARARRLSLADDYRLDRALGFAGME
jgi:preprotein translocase subunit SecA